MVKEPTDPLTREKSSKPLLRYITSSKLEENIFLPFKATDFSYSFFPETVICSTAPDLFSLKTFSKL